MEASPGKEGKDSGTRDQTVLALDFVLETCGKKLTWPLRTTESELMKECWEVLGFLLVLNVKQNCCNCSCFIEKFASTFWFAKIQWCFAFSVASLLLSWRRIVGNLERLVVV